MILISKVESKRALKRKRRSKREDILTGKVKSKRELKREKWSKKGKKTYIIIIIWFIIIFIAFLWFIYFYSVG